MTMDLLIYHWLLIAAFVAIVIWAFGRKRKARFEKDARIPFDDEKG
jgi:cytochrome c oxidase cbb3-type subunit 4